MIHHDCFGSTIFDGDFPLRAALSWRNKVSNNANEPPCGVSSTNDTTSASFNARCKFSRVQAKVVSASAQAAVLCEAPCGRRR
ncbi:MAG: hypothetical protein L6Q45_16605, partial [Anaerolineales bacterium]|nr:hypothetical protein [Anaerolineales bacterium]